MGSSVAWADNLIFDGTTLIWNTSEDNKSFADENDAPAAFAAGDNVSFSGESTVTLGEDISAGTVAIEKDADVTIDLDVFKLNVDRIELSGLLDMGYSLNIGAGTTLAMNGAGAVLDSNLVLGEKGVLTVTGAGGSLNGHSLTLQQGASLILTGAVISRETTDVDQDGKLSLIVTPTGDGKTYTLLTGVDVLVDKTGNALAAGSYAIDDLFDSTLPGSGFWTGGTLVYAADGTLTLIRHNETVKSALDVASRQTDNTQDYRYYVGISFKNLTTTGSAGGAISGYMITLSDNGSVVFSRNTSETSIDEQGRAYGGAIYGVDNGGGIVFTNNGSVTFSENVVVARDDECGSACGGAILAGSISCITLEGNGCVVFRGNTAEAYGFTDGSAFGGAIHGGSNTRIDLHENNSIEFIENKTNASVCARGGAIWSYCEYGFVSLNQNSSVSFKSNEAVAALSSYGEGDICISAYGGAIYGDSELNNNRIVNFSGNRAASGVYATEDTGRCYAFGGAVYGEIVELCYNGSVVFNENDASGYGNFGNIDYDGECTYSKGGSIYGGIINLNNNESLIFSLNLASANYSTDGKAHGGAINGESVVVSNNGRVSYVENVASFRGASGSAEGGAVRGSIITLRDNSSVEFVGNVASSSSFGTYDYNPVSFASGGAIYAEYYNGVCDVVLSNNGIVTFSRNAVLSSFSYTGAAHYAYGGAIYVGGNLSIRNNDSVLFEQNAEARNGAYRLRSIYAYGGYDYVISLSAAAGKSIEFWDSVYIGSGSTVNLNADYTYQDAEGVSVTVKQKGDILFTGATTVDELYAVKGNIAGTEEEILLSRTTEVRTIANLYNGRLIIKEGSIWSGDGITVASAEGKTYKPILLLQNGHLSHYEPSDSARNVVTIKSGATLEVAGKNTASYTSLILEGGSTLTFNLSPANTSADTAVLSMSDSSLTLPQSGTVTLKLVAFDGITDSQSYALLTGVNQPASWNNASITVASGTNGWDVSVADLCWDGTTLWLYYDARPDLETATWTNESGDGKWNTSSVNWEQNEIDYEYKNGVAVVFDGQGAGTVDLVGELAPGSVLVNNATGQDYTFGGSGSLAGDMKLTKKGAGNLIISTANSYTGGTVIDNSLLTITHANALGTGGIVTKGNSRLVVNGVTLKLQGTIDNTAGGELSLKGALDASALAYTYQSDTRVSLDGLEVGKTKSGFGKDGQYQVVIVNGGTTKNEGVMVQHDNHRLRIPLMLGADGVAYASMAGVDYSRYHLTGDDRIAVSEIADVSYRESGMELVYVDMDGGELEVDQSIAVNATGGSIDITKAATLSGSIEDTAVSTADGDYSSKISALLKGDTTLEVNGGSITVSGDNSYSGGTVVNGGTLLANHNKAFGAGDVTVNNGGTLDLSTYVVPNKVFMNGTSTLENANGASHIALGGGSQVSFSNGFTLGSGKTLEVAAGGAAYTGALTLGGGTLLLADKLTVQGDVVFEAGKSTTIDISGWTTAGDGTVLVEFGNDHSGYADGCLTLGGIAGDWELAFDSATGLLTLEAVQNQPVLPPVVFEPNLDRNQQEVYDTMKDIMADGNPGGVLGQLGQNIIGTRDEAELKRALDEISGREYATIMSSQMEGNMGHLRRLRASAGKGTPLGEYVTFGCCYPSNKGVYKSDNKGSSVMIAPSPVIDSRRIRAGVSAFHEQGELDADANGDGFERSETGAQLTMEYLVSNDFVLGMGLSHSRTKLSPTYGKRRDEDNTHVDLYGVYQSGRWSSTTALGVGLHQHELGRTVAGMQTEAEADGLSVNFMQELAYSVYADEEQGLQVFGSVESSFNQVDAFSETGADNASLCVEEQDAWVTDVTLGLRYNHTLPALGKAPAGMFSVQGGVVASLGDREHDVSMRFAGAEAHGYKQHAAERSRWGYNVGVSVNLPVTAETAVFGSAEAVIRNASTSVDAQVGVKMAF